MLHSKHIILFIINIKNIQPDISLLAPRSLQEKAELDVLLLGRGAAVGAQPLHCQDWASIAAALPSAVLRFNWCGTEDIFRCTSLMSPSSRSGNEPGGEIKWIVLGDSLSEEATLELQLTSC